MRTTYRITTDTGSIYWVHWQDGQFFLTADNISTPVSRSLQDGEWEIRQPIPWPVELGASVMFLAARAGAQRMPGGGKLTSAVRTVEQL